MRRGAWGNALPDSLSAVCAAAQGATALPDRTILPIQEPKRSTYKDLDVRNVKTPAHTEVKAPAGAPNVVIILIDDLGFGATGTYGGPIATPTLERLAQDGLRYINFHSTALCSPTRATLKSGRNHHMVNMGFITEMATGFPGATGQIPNTTAPVAESVADLPVDLFDEPLRFATLYTLSERALMGERRQG